MEDADRHDQIESPATLKELLDRVQDDPNIDESDVRDAAIRAVNAFDESIAKTRLLAAIPRPRSRDDARRRHSADRDRRQMPPRVPGPAQAPNGRQDCESGDLRYTARTRTERPSCSLKGALVERLHQAGDDPEEQPRPRRRAMRGPPITARHAAGHADRQPDPRTRSSLWRAT